MSMTFLGMQHQQRHTAFPSPSPTGNTGQLMGTGDFPATAENGVSRGFFFFDDDDDDNDNDDDNDSSPAPAPPARLALASDVGSTSLLDYPAWEEYVFPTTTTGGGYPGYPDPLTFFDSYPDRGATSFDNGDSGGPGPGSGSGCSGNGGSAFSSSGYACSSLCQPPPPTTSGTSSSSFMDSTPGLDLESLENLENLDMSTLAIPPPPPPPCLPCLPPSSSSCAENTPRPRPGKTFDMGSLDVFPPGPPSSGSFSFALLGMPGAEEAFLSQFDDPIVGEQPPQVEDIGFPFPESQTTTTTTTTMAMLLLPVGEREVEDESSVSESSGTSGRKRGWEEEGRRSIVKRQRVGRESAGVESGFESEEGEDESDVYVPSRVGSPAGEWDGRSRKARVRKGKAKGSAARALAMVTKAREEQDHVEMINEPSKDRAGVAVGHLNKKSRGRKVPYVAALRGGEGIGEGIPRGLGGDEERTFVCVVAGCGKCFVRGEHLKRHVRSIHTDDKPHLCPYRGCGKSFSRRDNLGQHVRIHLDE